MSTTWQTNGRTGSSLTSSSYSHGTSPLFSSGSITSMILNAELASHVGVQEKNFGAGLGSSWVSFLMHLGSWLLQYGALYSI